MTNLFQSGDFTLNSGMKSKWKLECDALTSEDWDTLAIMVREIVGPYSKVLGVPRGGIPLETRLSPFVSKEGPVLLVDDVLTTGGSIERLLEKEFGLEAEYRCLTEGVKGVVVFARGKCPYWIKAIFQMYNKSSVS